MAAIVTASVTDVGKVRSENQDSCGDFRHAAGERLLILADGMGGHQGGATASRLCVDAFARVFEAQEGAAEERLRRSFERANEVIYETALAKPELQGMGATGVALLVVGIGTAWIGWVGDSRVYRLRGSTLEALTEDHSLVAEWVRIGVLSPEEAVHHPRRSELLRAVGVAPDVEADIKQIDVAAGDVFLLCSDGLCGVVPEVEIENALASEPPDVAARRLVDRANALGGPDNVTVQIASIPRAPAEPFVPVPVPDPASGSEPQAAVPVAGPTPSPAPQAPAPFAATRLPPPPPAHAPAGTPRGAYALSALIGAVSATLVLALGFGYLAPTSDTESRHPPAAEGARAAPPPRVEVEPEAVQVEPPPPELPAAPRPEELAEPLEPEPDAAAPELEDSSEVVEDADSEPAAPAAEAPSPEATEVHKAAEATEADEADEADEAVVAELEPPAPEAVPAEAAPSQGIVVPPPVPTAAGYDVDAGVREFVDAWMRAIAGPDFAAYRGLGFPEPEPVFQQTYGSWEAYRIEALEVDSARSQDGAVYLRLVLSYIFEDPTGRWRTEDEHRLVLVGEPDGLRYQARWK